MYAFAHIHNAFISNKMHMSLVLIPTSFNTYDKQPPDQSWLSSFVCKQSEQRVL